MKTIRLLPIVLAIAGCGGGSRESAANETVAAMNDYVKILEGVTDKASAEKARPKLNDIASRLDGILKDVGAMKEPSEAEAKKVEEIMQKAMDSISDRMDKVMERLGSNPDLQMALTEPVMAISGKMMQLRGQLGG